MLENQLLYEQYLRFHQKGIKLDICQMVPNFVILIDTTFAHKDNLSKQPEKRLLQLL